MDKEALEQRIAELERQQKENQKPPRKFTDDLEIPENLDPAGLKSLLEKFEEHLQETVGTKLQDLEKKSKAEKSSAEQKEFNVALEKFKAEHPKLFEAENADYLDIMQTLLNKEIAEGKTPGAAFEGAFDKLGKVSAYKEEEETPKGSEEGGEGEEEEEGEEELTLLGSLNSASKPDDKTLQHKGRDNSKEAVKDVVKELKSEGLVFPS